MTDDEQFVAIIQAQWDQDEADKLNLNTPVRIDLEYLQKTYCMPMEYLLEHGHGQEGVVQDVWKEVDGFYKYHVDCKDGIIRGAYARKDLVCLSE